MNTPKLPIIVFALLGLSIIAFQYTQNAKLKKELKDQSSKEIGSSGEGKLDHGRHWQRCIKIFLRFE